jgi:4-hydroxy-tetrahydrodipicolinate synthase
VDLEATAAHAEHLIRAGVHGLIMLGSVGENTVLDPAEKRAVLATAIEVVQGRVPVLSGVAESSTAGACRFAADAEAAGADGLMVLPAMIYKTDRRETVSHFRAVQIDARRSATSGRWPGPATCRSCATTTRSPTAPT